MNNLENILTISIIDEDKFLGILKAIGTSNSGGVIAKTYLATVEWPELGEKDTYIKIFKNNERNKEIINESFGYLLAHQVKLKQAPQAGLIKIAAIDFPTIHEDGYEPQDGYYYAWASCSIGSENMKKIHFKPPYKSATSEEIKEYYDYLNEWDDFPRLIAFDDWVGNCDRNPGNMIFIKKNDIAVIDHGLIFNGVNWLLNPPAPFFYSHNHMWNNFVNSYNGNPSNIACQPLLNEARDQKDPFLRYKMDLKYYIGKIFKILELNKIGSITVDEVIDVLINFFEQRILVCETRFKRLIAACGSLAV